MTKKELQDRYEILLKALDIKQDDMNNIYAIVQSLIKEFMNSHKRVAVYCYGCHTRRLMADFVFELRDIIAIIDNGMLESEIVGYKIIRDEDIQSFNIDGVIISSYIHRESIKSILKEKHPDVDVLDIYDGLEKHNCNHIGTYYSNSPVMIYKYINSKKRQLALQSESDNQMLLWDIIKTFVSIKDFRMALETAKMLSDDISANSIISEIDSLYQKELEAISEISKNNVVLLCLDGLRRCDVNQLYMQKIGQYLHENAYIFENGYSFSTSTFESLVPAYSENSDQRTEYYKKNTVQSCNCRFMCEALAQDRNVFFYSDSYHYIDDAQIKYSETSQTVTEKIWDFILDAINEDNGLFYIHEVYESHYSFANPYTLDNLIADGSAMLFDFLPSMGGKLRCDYEKQHADSLHYLDDTLYPFVSKLKCRLLLFADHGNMILKPGTTLKEIPVEELVAAEDWIQIPLAIISPEYPVASNAELVSLMDINELVLSLLQKRSLKLDGNRDYIKIGRSELYNPNFKYIYHKLGQAHSLSAFEGFIFKSGRKLLVFADGTVELYTSDDERLNEENEKYMLMELIKNDITVCNLNDFL